MPVLPTRPPRRAVLVGALAAVGLACGCGARTSSGPGSTADDGDDGAGSDARVAAEAVALAGGLLDLVDATTTRHPGLRDQLSPLRASHRALVDLLDGLDGAATPPPSPTPPPARPGRARQGLLEAERDAVSTYLELAGDADGGRLARVLAAAAAGIAQAVAGLDPDGPPPAVLAVELDASGAPAATTEALQTTLAAEHAAVWTLPVVGARPFGSDDPEGAGGLGDLVVEVDEAYEAHRARRDELVAALTAAGTEPVAAAAAYDSPELGRGQAPRREAALAVEDATAATYAFLVASTAGERRSWAVAGLLDAALRRVDLGGDPQPLPGT